MNCRPFVVFLLSLATVFSSELQCYGAAADPKTQRLFDIKIQEASDAFDKDDYAMALKKTEEADTLLPDQPAALNLRGAVLYKERKYDEALAVFQKLIDKDTNSYPGYFNTAEVLLAEKKYDESLAGFERILEARPKDELCMYRIVLLLALKGDIDGARRRVKTIPNPGQTAAYYFANAAIEFIAGNAQKGQGWIKQSEVFFPAADSKSLRSVLVEHGLIPK